MRPFSISSSARRSSSCADSNAGNVKSELFTNEATQQGQVHLIIGHVSLFGRFEDLWQRGQAGVVHDVAERLYAERSLFYVGMAVHARAKTLLRVVHVYCSQPVEADNPVE